MDSISWVMYLLLLVLVGLSAFFSASETAFSTVNKIRLKHYAEEGSHKALTALEVAENYDNTISTILIGNNIVNIGSASLATVIATALFGAAGAAISTVVMTIVVLIFGEILPKSFAKANSEVVALRTAGIIRFLMMILSPIVKLFKILTDSITKTDELSEKTPTVTEQELKIIIEAIEEEGVLEEQESELVQSALEFDEIMVQEVLTPRVDMVAIDLNDDIGDIVEEVLQERFTRIPVYEKNIDNVIGVLQTRDLLEQVIRGTEIDVRSLLSDALFVHKTKKISSLLADFKRKRLHMAVVTDDYGGTMGIVTMEDLLEQLVGDIWDEDEEEEHDLVKVGDNKFEVSGDMNVYDLLEIIEYNDKNFDSEYNSMSGWALEMFQRIPEVGDSFVYDTLKVTVTALEEQRITKLLVEVEEAI